MRKGNSAEFAKRDARRMYDKSARDAGKECTEMLDENVRDVGQESREMLNGSASGIVMHCKRTCVRNLIETVANIALPTLPYYVILNGNAVKNPVAFLLHCHLERSWRIFSSSYGQKPFSVFWE